MKVTRNTNEGKHNDDSRQRLLKKIFVKCAYLNRTLHGLVNPQDMTVSLHGHRL